MRPLLIATAQIRLSRFAPLKAAGQHLENRPSPSQKPCCASSKEPHLTSCIGRSTHALRPRYTRAPAEIHMHSGRDTHVLRPMHVTKSRLQGRRHEATQRPKPHRQAAEVPQQGPQKDRMQPICSIHNNFVSLASEYKISIT